MTSTPSNGGAGRVMDVVGFIFFFWTPKKKKREKGISYSFRGRMAVKQE
jgi:hypothetical protein